MAYNDISDIFSFLQEDGKSYNRISAKIPTLILFIIVAYLFLFFDASIKLDNEKDNQFGFYIITKTFFALMFFMLEMKYEYLTHIKRRKYYRDGIIFFSFVLISTEITSKIFTKNYYSTLLILNVLLFPLIYSVVLEIIKYFIYIIRNKELKYYEPYLEEFSKVPEEIGAKINTYKRDMLVIDKSIFYIDDKIHYLSCFLPRYYYPRYGSLGQLYRYPHYVVLLSRFSNDVELEIKQRFYNKEGIFSGKYEYIGYIEIDTSSFKTEWYSVKELINREILYYLTNFDVLLTKSFPYDKVKEYWDNGNIKCEGLIRQGSNSKIYEWKYYYESGNLHKIMYYPYHFNNNEKLRKIFNEKGNLIEQFVDNGRFATSTFFWDNGNIQKQRILYQCKEYISDYDEDGKEIKTEEIEIDPLFPF